MGSVKLSCLYTVSGRLGPLLAFAAAAAFLAASALPARGGPWVRPRGGHFLKISASYLYTTSEFNEHGDPVPLLTANPLVQDAAYREVAIATYLEYGISDRLSLIGYLPFKILTSRRTEISELADLIREIDVTNAGFSDLSLGVRRALRTGRTPVAIDLVGTVPLGYDREPDNSGPALGTGYPDLLASLQAGASLHALYASAAMAYRVRGGPLADDIGFTAQFGGARQRVSGYALVEGWYATVTPEALDVSSTTAPSNQDVLKFIASLSFAINQEASIATEVFHVLEGRNTPTGTTGSIALVLTR
ncbi:MAG TPA: hypothetical protein VFX92_13380 [Candidatus Krumholzibacteria bacterium]|nr:hypothetical protein [Candidatus Krumholzibacteria bacterium]